MNVSDAMTSAILTVGPAHTLSEVAEKMAERNIGSAVVHDPDGEGPGIITERDIMRAVAEGVDCSAESVHSHHADNLTIAEPGWSLEQAAATMLRGGFRHLVVCDGPEVVGVLSMRDIVRLWTSERMPAM